MSPPAGVSLWFLSPGAADAQKGLPSVVQLLPLLRWLRAAVFKVGGQGHSWDGPRAWSWSSSQGQAD